MNVIARSDIAAARAVRVLGANDQRRLEALHRVVRARRNPAADHGGGRRIARRAPAGPRQHRHRLRRAQSRIDRCLSRVHRHDRVRAAGQENAREPGRASGGTRKAGPGRRHPARLQQYLRARDLGEGGRAGRLEARLAVEGAQRPQARVVAGIPEPQGRVAGVEERLWLAAGAARARPRARLRSAGGGAGRRDRRLFDRRQDRPLPGAPHRRRSEGASPLRRGAHLPARFPAALSEVLGGARRARRRADRSADGGAQCGGRIGRPGLRRGRAGFCGVAAKHARDALAWRPRSRSDPFRARTCSG